MIRAVVFDLWNTLVHSEGGDPFQHLKRVLGPAREPWFKELKRDAMVQPHADADAFIRRWCPRMDLNEAECAELAEVFRRGTATAEAFPETLEALRRTREIARLGLLSNTQSFDMDFLERLGLSEAISSRFLSAETGLLKPDAAAFELVQRRMGLFPGQIAMVGDSWNDDVKGGLEAGWTVLWLNRTGRPMPEHDPEAELVEIRDLGQVPELIERLQAGARCSTCLG